MDKSGNQYQENAVHAWSADSIRLYGIPGNAVKDGHFYMQEAGHFKTEWPYFTERVGLNSFLIVYTLSGEGRLVYEEKEYHLKAGSCFWIHCMKYHEYYTKKGKKWEFLWIHFNGNGALGYYRQFIQNGFHLLEGGNQRLETQLKEILTVNQNRNAATEISTMRCIVGILAELIIDTSAGDNRMEGLPEYIISVQRYLEKHFAEKISLDGLAELFHISKFYLIKEFKRYVGVSPYEYLIEIRMACAKELLKYSKKTIVEIALLCGMSQTSHFIRLFKEREGKTPLQYRKEWR